jgi:CBS domain-containing protein
MTLDTASLTAFFSRHHPFDLLPAPDLATLAETAEEQTLAPGGALFAIGDRLTRIHVVESGEVDLLSPEGDLVARAAGGEILGAKTLLRDGTASLRAVSDAGARLIAIPEAVFRDLLARHPRFDAFFDRLRDTARRKPAPAGNGAGAALVSAELRDIMTAGPLMLAATTSAREAARAMAERNISCVLVGENGVLSGIVTTGDLTARVLAEGRDPDVPLSQVMTPDPAALAPGALLLDALMLMSRKGIGHLPVCEDGRAVGIVTRTNLVRHQSLSAVSLISDIARHDTFDALAATVAQVPQLLAQLVGLGVEAYRIGHMISSVTDALTRRLIELAQAELGPAPVPWLWLACGSQGRREQTGVSDQDNCLILDDAYDEARHGKWFAEFARYVSDGLHACGYVYCPGDMMATNPRWRQPAKVWKSYFEGWIATPDPMAQMLASVMFDLRPIDGDSALFSGMQRRTLDLARRNSIFRAHMTANSLKHTPPLGLFRGFALIRSGEHKDTLDLKHSGVVPIVDLARLYALEGALEPVNTRERLIAAREAGTLSASGGSDLIDAYDLISNIRLAHQARQVREGQKPDNFMAPATLSALERNHLKDAFGVIKTLQSAAGHGRAL